MSRKKNKPTPPALSPRKYILTRARSLDIYKCLVNKNWRESGLASLIIMRQHSNGHITSGSYLVDLFARGVKDTDYIFNKAESDLLELIYEQWPEDYLQEIPYNLAHNIIYGGAAFAEEHGFKQHPAFELTQYLLEEDTDAIEIIELEFGKEGKPFILQASDQHWKPHADRESRFEQFTDDQWIDFFNKREPYDRLEYGQASEVLFDRWYRETYPEGLARLKKHTREIKVTNEPQNLHWFKTDEEHRESESIYFELQNAKTPKARKRIREKVSRLMAANPQNPLYHNYLGICADSDREFKHIVVNTVRLFPDYLFGRLALANELMDHKQFDAAEKIFGNCYQLTESYPERKTFHMSELIGFNSAMIRLFLHKDNMEEAYIYFKMLTSLVSDHLLLLDRNFHRSEKEFVARTAVILEKYVFAKGYLQ